MCDVTTEEHSSLCDGWMDGEIDWGVVLMDMWLMACRADLMDRKLQSCCCTFLSFLSSGAKRGTMLG